MVMVVMVMVRVVAAAVLHGGRQLAACTGSGHEILRLGGRQRRCRLIAEQQRLLVQAVGRPTGGCLVVVVVAAERAAAVAEGRCRRCVGRCGGFLAMTVLGRQLRRLLFGRLQGGGRGRGDSGCRYIVVVLFGGGQR